MAVRAVETVKVTMPHPRRPERANRLTLHIACAAAGVFVTLGAWQAAAQDRDALRGEVPEDAVNAELLRRQQRENALRDNAQQQQSASDALPQRTTAPAYRPLSDGAVADDGEEAAPASDSVFADDAEAAGFSEPLPARGKAPSTARQRREAARDSLQPAETDRSTDRRRPSETATRIGQQADAEETTGAIERVEAVESESADRLDEGAEREEAIESIDRAPDENPYAPLGLRLGSFNVYTTLEQGLNWTDNVNYSTDPQSALQSETTLRLRAESDWAEHAAALEGYGTLRETLDGPKIDDNEVGLNGSLRYDFADDFRATGTLRYQYKPESASSPVVIEDAVSRPVRQTLEGTAGIEKDVGKLRLSAVAGITRDSYDDAKLESGGELSQRERNSTLANIKLRTGYEISPALVPFVEVEAGRRRYEVEVDAAGFQRSSDRLAARAGVEVDLGEKLRGEIAAGWLREKPDDDRLEDISGPTVDASVTWSPVRGTNVNLFGSTTVEGTTTPNESGSLLYTGRIAVDRQLRANLTGTALAGAAWRDYVGSNGHDLTLTAETSLTWWLNRYLGVTGRARHERVESNLEGRDTKTNSVFLGVKLQR